MDDTNEGGRLTAVERLRRVSKVVDLVSLRQALDVPVEDVRGYLSGALAYPDTEEGERRLRQTEVMCEALGDFNPDDPEEAPDGYDLGSDLAGATAGLAGEVERDEALVLSGGRSDWVVSDEDDDDEDPDAEGPEATGGKPAYARFGDAPASCVLGREPEAEPMVVGLDTDGDGKMDMEFPGAVVVPRSGNWNEDIEERRQQLWTAWSIARMTQHRLMKRRETVAALGWVAEIELALISFYGESLPEPGQKWDLKKQAEEVDIRLSRLRWVQEEQEKEYGGLKGAMRWLLGDRRPGGKELYTKMVEEADKLLDTVGSVKLGQGGLGIMETVIRQREEALRRDR